MLIGVLGVLCSLCIAIRFCNCCGKCSAGMHGDFGGLVNVMCTGWGALVPNECVLV